MSERDELLAEAEAKGIPIDKRLGVDKLRVAIAKWESDRQAHADGFATEGDRAAAYPDDEAAYGESDDLTDGDILDIADVAAAEVVAEMQPATDDGWPKRIAPCAWLDQDGNRWTDLGQAGEAVERIRRR